MKLTQKDAVLRHMKDYGSISSIEAFEEYGITRLAARIFELKNDDGIAIHSVPIQSTNRYGDKIIFTRYSLAT